MLLRGGAVQATKALVINEGRGQAGLAAAELLLCKGIEVEIISSDIAVGADIDPTNRTAWFMRLGEKGCQFSAAQIVVSAQGNRVACRNVYDDRIKYREGIDLIHYIGDCVSPRSVEIAMGEAEELANRL